MKQKEAQKHSMCPRCAPRDQGQQQGEDSNNQTCIFFEIRVIPLPSGRKFSSFLAVIICTSRFISENLKCFHRQECKLSGDIHEGRLLFPVSSVNSVVGCREKYKWEGRKAFLKALFTEGKSTDFIRAL